MCDTEHWRCKTSDRLEFHPARNPSAGRNLGMTDDLLRGPILSGAEPLADRYPAPLTARQRCRTSSRQRNNHADQPQEVQNLGATDIPLRSQSVSGAEPLADREITTLIYSKRCRTSARPTSRSAYSPSEGRIVGMTDDLLRSQSVSGAEPRHDR